MTPRVLLPVYLFLIDFCFLIARDPVASPFSLHSKTGHPMVAYPCSESRLTEYCRAISQFFTQSVGLSPVNSLILLGQVQIGKIG
jgi:hypothetical protein